MGRTRRCAWGRSFKLLAVPPSTCPHNPPAVPAQHRGEHTFTNSPGGPGGPTGPGGPGSPKGPCGPGLPGGPVLPWRTEMLRWLGPWHGLGVVAETPWYRDSQTYRRARLPFPAWQPLSIHDHPGLSLDEEGEKKSVSPCVLLCPQCRTGVTVPWTRQGDPGVSQTPSTRRCQGLRCTRQGPRCSPGTPLGQPHARYLPARLSPPSGQKAPSAPASPGKTRVREVGAHEGEWGWGGMGPYSRDLLGGQGCPGCPGKQQLRR